VRTAALRDLPLRPSAGVAGAIEGGRFGRGAQPPSEEIECHAHRHKEVTL